MQNIFNKKAKNNRAKTLLAIATLTFLMASSTFVVLNTQAAIAWPNYKTSGFISIAPNPIGVGQTAVVKGIVASSKVAVYLSKSYYK